MLWRHARNACTWRHGVRREAGSRIVGSEVALQTPTRARGCGGALGRVLKPFADGRSFAQARRRAAPGSGGPRSCAGHRVTAAARPRQPPGQQRRRRIGRRAIERHQRRRRFTTRELRAPLIDADHLQLDHVRASVDRLVNANHVHGLPILRSTPRWRRPILVGVRARASETAREAAPPLCVPIDSFGNVLKKDRNKQIVHSLSATRPQDFHMHPA